MEIQILLRDNDFSSFRYMPKSGITGAYCSCFGGFPGSSASKESACNAGDLSSISNPGGGHGNPLQYSWASLVAQENLHEQRSLAGCSPWGRRQSDTTERLSTAQCTVCHHGFNSPVVHRVSLFPHIYQQFFSLIFLIIAILTGVR